VDPAELSARLVALVRGRLLQVLGVAFGLAVIIGNTIIVGILRTPGDVAARLPTTGLFLGVWVLGGIYALLGAISLAEPGAMYPRSGGQYTIVRRALGEYPGFIVGWSDWISTSGTISSGSIVFSEYLVPLIRGLQGRNTAVACGVALAFGLLLWRGIRIGDLTQQILSALKALSFGAIILACLIVPVPAPASAPVPIVVPTGIAFIGALVVALQAVIYTYDGWSGPLYFGEEIKDPGRAVPRAMAGGVLLVIVIYLLLNLALVRVLGVHVMAGDPFVAATAGKVLFGDQGDLVIRLLVLLAILGGINATVLMASRVPLAMSSDGLMPRSFQTVNTGGTPTVSHWASIGVALAFILTNTFNGVLAILAFFFVANYCLSFTSVFVLRRRDPDAPRPYKAWGYPWTTGIALAGSAAFLVGAVATDWGNSWKSLVLLALSWPVFRMVRRR
jgi:basic amino acid/polyamine antiporter, APA family